MQRDDVQQESPALPGPLMDKLLSVWIFSRYSHIQGENPANVPGHPPEFRISWKRGSRNIVLRLSQVEG